MQKISRINVRFLKTLVLVGLLLPVLLFAGCTSPSASVPDLSTGVTNGAIIKNPAAYEGRELVLSGKIAMECSSGCWFLLDDGTGQLYVDLGENNFAIPQLQGSTATVKGIIRIENGDPKFFATNVTVARGSYP